MCASYSVYLRDFSVQVLNSPSVYQDLFLWAVKRTNICVLSDAFLVKYSLATSERLHFLMFLGG